MLIVRWLLLGVGVCVGLCAWCLHRSTADKLVSGDLCFTLPAAATVVGYALEIDGALVEGVVVEKDKARITFEQEVSKGGHTILS